MRGLEWGLLIEGGAGFIQATMGVALADFMGRSLVILEEIV